ncbi:methyltransferase domain-containing protein [Nocardiopsis sp. RSe5-2]|uniref:Methyltransferase domain-containing protein n=1 Tax=Nocardiopsis endophytica TaxID=3018445 RepID=A0ABT4UE96_9ACTN|nr:methyltransferase domain-containing protein [Nocardiopsis endophytica]MDA2815281.1 methyltransferase domain-containing protein [Nocardiopsis endophytica]
MTETDRMTGPAARDADETEGLIAALDAFDTVPRAAALRERSHTLLAPPPGGTVVDAGCGAGRAVAELAGLGAVPVGIDADPRMVAAARDRVPGADVRVGDAALLPLADSSAAGYRAEKVLHALPDPARAVAEAHRVLAPGGRAVLLGQDWDGYLIDADDADLTRRITAAAAQGVPSPDSARRFPSLLRDAGFTDVRVEAHVLLLTDPVFLPVVAGAAHGAHAAGAVSAEEADGWVADQRNRAQEGRFSAAMCFFLAVGVRPGD